MRVNVLGTLWLSCVLISVSHSASGMERQRSDSLHVLSLEDLTSSIIDRSPIIRSADVFTDVLGWRAKTVDVLSDPTVSVSYQPLPILTARGWQRTQMRLEQKVPYPGKFRLKKSIALLSVDASRARKVSLREDILLRARTTYIEMFRLQSQRSLIEEFQARLVSFEEAAIAQYEVGRGSQQAIVKAQLERNVLSQKLMFIDEQRFMHVSLLNELLNCSDCIPDDGSIQLLPPQIPIADDVTIEKLTERRSDAFSKKLGIEQLSKQEELVRKERFPDFTFSLNYFDIAPTDLLPTANGRDAIALGIGLQIPLWDDDRDAKLQSLVAERRQRMIEYQQIQTAIETTINGLRGQQREQERQLEMVNNTLLPQARVAVEASRSAYVNNKTDYLDLLEGERQLFNLEMLRIDINSRILETKVRLHRNYETNNDLE